MKNWISIHVMISLALFLPLFCHGKEIVGMSRTQILANFGKPQSALENANKEILNYPQGQIVLDRGKVTSYKGTFLFNEIRSETPVQEEAPVVEKPAIKLDNAPDMSRRTIEPFWWSYMLTEAQARSVKDGRPILALFTGPDWCAPCQKLEEEVLNTTEFKILGRKKYIPLKVALYRNTPQEPRAKEEYYRLSREYHINAVPSFAILESDGTLIGKPDLFKPRKNVSSFAEQVFAAIKEAENPPVGMSLSMQIGIGAVIAGLTFFFFRR